MTLAINNYKIGTQFEILQESLNELKQAIEGFKKNTESIAYKHFEHFQQYSSQSQSERLKTAEINIYGKVWEIMGKPLKATHPEIAHRDYGRVAFHNQEGRSVTNAVKAEALESCFTSFIKKEAENELKLAAEGFRKNDEPSAYEHFKQFQYYCSQCEELKNIETNIYGKVWEIMGKPLKATHPEIAHRDYGRVAFHNQEGRSVTSVVKAEALESCFANFIKKESQQVVQEFKIEKNIEVPKTSSPEKVLIQTTHALESPKKDSSIESITWMKMIHAAIRFSSPDYDENVQLNVIQGLLEKGRRLGLLDQLINGKGVVHLLSQLPQCKGCISLMIRTGVDLALQDEDGNTGLIWTIANANNGKAMEMIKGGGAAAPYLDIKGLFGNTALHLAVGKGYKNLSASGQILEHSNHELVQALIDQRVNVNQQNEKGNTALHFACLRHDLSMIRLLLSSGADPHIKNHDNKSPQELIKMDYDSAFVLINSEVFVTLLDKQEYEANLKEATEFFI